MECCDLDQRCAAVLKYFPEYVPSEHPPENAQYNVVITMNLYLTAIVLEALGCISYIKNHNVVVSCQRSTRWLASASRSIAHQHSSRLHYALNQTPKASRGYRPPHPTRRSGERRELL